MAKALQVVTQPACVSVARKDIATGALYSRLFIRFSAVFSNPPSSSPRKQQQQQKKKKNHGSISYPTQEKSGIIFDILLVMAEAIDLTGDGGVLKTVIREAKADAVAPSDGLPLVDVHYEGTLAENGEVFDTTHEDNSVFSFEIGEGTVIKAWDVAVKTMKVGEVAKITCKPEYAYGAAGSPPEIPPDATLIFEVELVACRPRKGSSIESVSEEKARLEELKKQRETAAAAKEEEKRKRVEAKAAAATRVQAKLEAKKGKGKKAK